MMEGYQFIKEYPDTDYQAISHQSLLAAKAMLTATWPMYSQKAGVCLQTSPIVDPTTKLTIFKAQKTLPFPAATIFSYATSAKGFAILDPVSNPDDHYREPLLVHQVSSSHRYEIANTHMQIALIKREFLVLNTYDSHEQIFVSTSVAAPTLVHNCHFPSKQRAYNSFVLAVQAETPTSAVVTIVNFMDMRLTFPLSDAILNQMNRYFLQRLFPAIEHELAQQSNE
ncbi:MAG: hypothetical protein ACRC1D_05020 [Culicoidibacterales bacterium]